MAFPWSSVVAVLGHRPAGQSLLAPIHSSSIKDFNLGYALMGLVNLVYGTMAWQNVGGYQSAAFTRTRRAWAAS